MKKLLIFLVLFSTIKLVNAQFLVSAEKVDEVAKADNQNFLAVYDLDLYKVTYNSTDVNGDPDIQSGLMILPKDAAGKCFPMASVHHGTVNDRTTVPSNVDGGYELGVVFCGSGMIGVMPDLPGLGTSAGNQMYIHTESTATSTLDMMRAVREYIGDSDINFNGKVFITGYSQGGHSAMATFKDLEENHSDEFTVTAAAPMSGPYDVSKSMIDYTLSDEEYGFSSYLAAVSISMKIAYPEILADFGIEEIFRDEYHAAVKMYEDEVVGIHELNDELERINMELNGKIIPSLMMRPEALTDIRTPGTPLNNVLALQDLYDWTPKAPMQMYYCTEDEQVTFQNAVVTLERMTELGVDNVKAIDKGELDHNGCIEPAVTDCLLWWLGQLDIADSCITGTDDLAIYTNSIIQGANISDSYLQLQIDRVPNYDKPLLSIYSYSGQLMASFPQAEGNIRIDLSNYNSGMYVVSLMGNNTLLKAEKFMVK